MQRKIYRGDTMKIAIVEDDKFTQRMLMGYINRYYEMDQRRYSIDVFADGDEIGYRDEENGRGEGCQGDTEAG